jgi:hypothetical protein
MRLACCGTVKEFQRASLWGDCIHYTFRAETSQARFGKSTKKENIRPCCLDKTATGHSIRMEVSWKDDTNNHKAREDGALGNSSSHETGMEDTVLGVTDLHRLRCYQA